MIVEACRTRTNMERFSTDMDYRLEGQGKTGPVEMADSDPLRLMRRAALLHWWKMYDKNNELCAQKLPERWTKQT